MAKTPLAASRTVAVRVRSLSGVSSLVFGRRPWTTTTKSPLSPLPNTAWLERQQQEYDEQRQSQLPQTPAIRLLSTLSSNNSRRTMVMVTQTKASELPKHEESSSSSTKDDDMSTTKSVSVHYEVLSDVLTVTPSCLNRVEKLIRLRRQKQQQQQQQSQDITNNNNNNDCYFLRVFVDAGGCSGFLYQFEMDSQIDPDEDTIVVAANDTNTDTKNNDSIQSPRIVIDGTSLGFLKGSTLDYVQEMIKSSFVVKDNPQSESACGCGSSFAVKNFSVNPALD